MITGKELYQKYAANKSRFPSQVMETDKVFFDALSSSLKSKETQKSLALKWKRAIVSETNFFCSAEDLQKATKDVLVWRFLCWIFQKQLAEKAKKQWVPVYYADLTT